MASKNKKNKAKNSYISNGGEKLSMNEWKIKGCAYFTKRDRLLNKKMMMNGLMEDLEETGEDS